MTLLTVALHKNVWFQIESSQKQVGDLRPKSNRAPTSQCLQQGFWGLGMNGRGTSSPRGSHPACTSPVRRGNVNSSGTDPTQPQLRAADEAANSPTPSGLSNLPPRCSRSCVPAGSDLSLKP